MFICCWCREMKMVFGARLRRTGHFWQGRYGSVALDEPHILTALRYVALNPVRAGLADDAMDWPWASTRTLATGEADGHTVMEPVLQRVPNFSDLLRLGLDEKGFDRLRCGESIGRPLDAPGFIERLESLTGRVLSPAGRGRKPRADEG